MSEIILILGGTKEAAQLAEKLALEKPDARIISSLAGRTKEPKPLSGETRIGGFGGGQGLAHYMVKEGVTLLIDATHPFAKNISNNAKIAAGMTATPLEIITRNPWQKLENDHWIEVNTIEEARDKIPPDAIVFLALGSQHIAPFASRDDVQFHVRMVDQPTKPLNLPNHILHLGLPSDVPQETALLRQNHITHIVCRNSGGKGAYAKIEAARNLNLPVIMISQS